MRLRTRGHDFELPIIKYEFNKWNFIVQSVFNCVWFWVLLYYLHFVFYCTHVRMSYVLNSYLLTYLVTQYAVLPHNTEIITSPQITVTSLHPMHMQCILNSCDTLMLHYRTDRIWRDPGPAEVDCRHQLPWWWQLRHHQSSSMLPATHTHTTHTHTTHIMHGIEHTTTSRQRQQQLFYGPLSRTTRVSQYQKKHSTTHHPDHHPIFISFFHLPRSIASSLFKLRAWQSFCTTSLHDLLVYLLGCSLHLIRHTFLHPISVFFSQHMPIPPQPVLL